MHYNNSANDAEATNDHCVIGDPGQFHTYAVQWTPQSLTFLYDGQTVPGRSLELRPRLSTDPAPFNEPFYICLTQALGIGTNLFLPGSDASSRHDIGRLGPGRGVSPRPPAEQNT